MNYSNQREAQNSLLGLGGGGEESFSSVCCGRNIGTKPRITALPRRKPAETCRKEENQRIAEEWSQSPNQSKSQIHFTSGLLFVSLTKFFLISWPF